MFIIFYKKTWILSRLIAEITKKIVKYTIKDGKNYDKF